jgi:hypothetical protein
MSAKPQDSLQGWTFPLPLRREDHGTWRHRALPYFVTLGKDEDEWTFGISRNSLECSHMPMSDFSPNCTTATFPFFLFLARKLIWFLKQELFCVHAKYGTSGLMKPRYMFHHYTTPQPYFPFKIPNGNCGGVFFGGWG